MRWIGVALIVLGILGLFLGSLTVTEEEGKAQVGPVELRVEQKKRYPIPPWLGFVAIGAGLALVAVDVRRSR
jgi:hypothetical protein